MGRDRAKSMEGGDLYPLSQIQQEHKDFRPPGYYNVLSWVNDWLNRVRLQRMRDRRGHTCYGKVVKIVEKIVESL